MSGICVVVIIPVGHLSSSLAIFLSRWISFVGKDGMLSEIRRSRIVPVRRAFPLFPLETRLDVGRRNVQ